MWNKANLFYLAASACVLSLRSTTVKYSFVPDVLIWVTLSLAYPFYLPIVRITPRLWRELFHFLAILAIAQVVGFLAYFIWFGAHQVPPFRGSISAYPTQENTSLSAVICAGELVVSLVVAVICYPMAYVASRWLLRHSSSIEL